MDNGVALIICSLAALWLQSLHNAYLFIPDKELRRVAAGSKLHRKLHLVGRHGRLASIFLLGLSRFFVLVSVILVSREYNVLQALGILIILGGLLRLSATKLNRPLIWLAAFIAPHISEILTYLEPLSRTFKKLDKRKKKKLIKTEIYEKRGS